MLDDPAPVEPTDVEHGYDHGRTRRGMRPAPDRPRPDLVPVHHHVLPSGVSQHTDVLVGDLADGTLVTLTVKAERPVYDSAHLDAVARSAMGSTGD